MLTQHCWATWVQLSSGQAAVVALHGFNHPFSRKSQRKEEQLLGRFDQACLACRAGGGHNLIDLLLSMVPAGRLHYSPPANPRLVDLVSPLIVPHPAIRNGEALEKRGCVAWSRLVRACKFSKYEHEQ